MDAIYKCTEYSTNKESNLLIVFDDMVVGMLRSIIRGRN